MALRKRNFLVLLAAVPLALGLVAIRGGGPTVVRAFNPNTAPKIQQQLLDTAAEMALNFHAPDTNSAPPVHSLTKSDPPGYNPAANGECPHIISTNVKVNQNCLNPTAVDLQGRGQGNNETAIAVNPNNSNELIAASNDYVLGDGLAGGISFSTDGGATWQDSQVPLEFTRGSDFSGNNTARMYWQGGGDPSLAWDTHNNPYFLGLHFNRGSIPPAPVSDNPDTSSAVYLYRSIGNHGASFAFPGTPVVTSYDPSSATGGLPLLDKPYIAINDYSNRFKNRIFVTWTSFATDGTAYIYGAFSSDYGRTFSAPVQVTNASDSATLCPNTYGLATPNGPCNENQFSDPFFGPDGSLYVVFANFNNGLANANDNHNQMLITKSTNGGLSFGPTVQVANYNDLPDCNTYQGNQNPFRACLPEKGAQQNSVFRATNYPSGSVDPANGHVAVAFGSYINADSNPTLAPGSGNCVPAGFATNGDNMFTGVKTAGDCANKILLSVSSNGGASFTGTGKDPSLDTVVSSAANQKHTDQWWQWSAVNSNGELAVSYYDRQYGSDESNANNDMSLSLSSNLSTFSTSRVTSSSMPNPTEFPSSQGNSQFMGDYTGLAVSSSDAWPLWTDTRDVDEFDCATNPPSVCTATEPNGQQANDENIYTAKMGTGG